MSDVFVLVLTVICLGGDLFLLDLFSNRENLNKPRAVERGQYKGAHPQRGCDQSNSNECKGKKLGRTSCNVGHDFRHQRKLILGRHSTIIMPTLRNSKAKSNRWIVKRKRRDR
jgi:hypothetical protein